MDKKTKIYIAGHKGMVGAAIWRQLEKADELFRSGKLPKMSLVVNDFDPDNYDGYSSNYYYQYGYYENAKKPSFFKKMFNK